MFYFVFHSLILPFFCCSVVLSSFFLPFSPFSPARFYYFFWFEIRAPSFFRVFVDRLLHTTFTASNKFFKISFTISYKTFFRPNIQKHNFFFPIHYEIFFHKISPLNRFEKNVCVIYIIQKNVIYIKFVLALPVGMNFFPNF